jgi:phosphoribosylanthranilate isomerase
MIRVKICGITRKEDLDVAVQAGADGVGFIVDVPTSPRNLSLKDAKDLIDELPSNVDSVAVTAFKRIQRITTICRKLTPSYIQLHGRLPMPRHREELASQAKVIMAVDAKASNAIEEAISYLEFSQAVLVDTHGRGGLGGTGHTHDWNLSRKIRDAIYPKHVFLAGGLTPENVSSAIKKVRPYGVNVSTGVEVRPGIKDPMKITEFIMNVKGG